MFRIGNDWDSVLEEYWNSEDWAKTRMLAKAEYDKYQCFPPKSKIFSAFKDTPLSEVKLVILGQDPYYSIPQADGHCFSVTTKELPPSLINIYECLRRDYPDIILNSGSLVEWAKNGVLLLNTCLSVRRGVPLSHNNIGWDKLIDIVLKALNEKNNIVFMLWGKSAVDRMKLLPSNPNNLYLTAPHPSPLSAYRGFMTCGHFKKCNEFLKSKNIEEIDFNIHSKFEEKSC